MADAERWWAGTVALEARIPLGEDPCPVEAAELAAALADVLPDYGQDP